MTNETSTMVAGPSDEELVRRAATGDGRHAFAMLVSRHQSEVRNTLRRLTRGDAATEIIDYVKSNEIDLIVAGSRGLGQFEGMWMGSVSRKLVHYSNCSVLIVKGPKKE